MLKRVLNLDPRWYIITALLVLAVLGFKAYGLIVLSHTAGVCAITVLLDGFFLYLKKRELEFPLSGLVSGLIISTVLAPGNLFFIAPIAAILSKHLIRVFGKHIFNPAGFGLFVANVFFHLPLTWWLTTNILLVVFFGLILAYKVRKLGLALSFYCAMFVLSIIYSLINHQPALANISLINFFFILFMLVEPKTSPFYVKGQVIYGALTAGLALTSLIFLGQYDFLILGLMAGNVTNLFLRKVG